MENREVDGVYSHAWSNIKVLRARWIKDKKISILDQMAI